MPTLSPVRLIHASINKIVMGRHAWTHKLAVASTPSEARLNTIAAAASGHRAIRGQLLTIARPGTKR